MLAPFLRVCAGHRCIVWRLKVRPHEVSVSNCVPSKDCVLDHDPSWVLPKSAATWLRPEAGKLEANQQPEVGGALRALVPALVKELLSWAEAYTQRENSRSLKGHSKLYADFETNSVYYRTT